MSDRLYDRLKSSIRSRIGGWLRAVASLLVVVSTLHGSNAFAQVGGRGPDPIASFTQDVGGGGGGGPGVGPTVNFDPSSSYLPSPPAGQTYVYTLIWSWGDATASVTVGPGSSVAVLIPQQHVFPIPPVNAALDPNTVAGGLYTVTLEIDVTVINQNNITSPGPSSTTTGNVRSAYVNYPPTWSLVNNSSAPTGIVPFQVNVDCSASYDEDGFIMWAAIDWGDGSSNLVPSATLPPSKTPINLTHSYPSPGTYSITLSLIDNGRMASGTLLDPTPLANNPAAALSTIQALQHKLIDNGVLVGVIDPATNQSVFNADKYLPILRQQFIQVTIPGSLSVVKGTFALDFVTPNNDSFDSTFLLDQTFLFNGGLSAVVNTQVQVFFGAPIAANSFLNPFKTDLKGDYFNQAQGLKFSVIPKQRYMRFQVKTANLQGFFKLSNATVVNGFVDIPITFRFGDGVTTAFQDLRTTLRFVYNAKSGVSGKGKNPRSTLLGN